MGWLQKQHEDQSNGVSTFIILLYIYTHISTFEQCNIRIEITNIIHIHIKKRMICYRVNWIIWYKAKSIIILFDKKEPRYIHYMVSFKTITYVSTHTHIYIIFTRRILHHFPCIVDTPPMFGIHDRYNNWSLYHTHLLNDTTFNGSNWQQQFLYHYNDFTYIYIYTHLINREFN